MAWIMGNQHEVDESLKNVAARHDQEERERKEKEEQEKEGK